MVFEAASLGLSLKIVKCSFFPRHAMKALGTIVDLTPVKFSVAISRAEKICVARSRLRAEVDNNPAAVPAKSVASFIGLIWSIASCCHRAASVMVRCITATLSDGLRHCIDIFNCPLSCVDHQPVLVWHCEVVCCSRQATPLLGKGDIPWPQRSYFRRRHGTVGRACFLVPRGFQ